VATEESLEPARPTMAGPAKPRVASFITELNGVSMRSI